MPNDFAHVAITDAPAPYFPEFLADELDNEGIQDIMSPLREYDKPLRDASFSGDNIV